MLVVLVLAGLVVLVCPEHSPAALGSAWLAVAVPTGSGPSMLPTDRAGTPETIEATAPEHWPGRAPQVVQTPTLPAPAWSLLRAVAPVATEEPAIPAATLQPVIAPAVQALQAVPIPRLPPDLVWFRPQPAEQAVPVQLDQLEALVGLEPQEAPVEPLVRVAQALGFGQAGPAAQVGQVVPVLLQ